MCTAVSKGRVITILLVMKEMESSETSLNLYRLHGVTFRNTATLLLSFVIQPGSCSDTYFKNSDIRNMLPAVSCFICCV